MTSFLRQLLNKNYRLVVASLFLVGFIVGNTSSALYAKNLTIYSSRNEQLLKPLLDRFTKDTGIEVKLLTASEGPLLARLKAEGAGSPADVLMTVDAGNLWFAAQQGLLQPLDSAVLKKNVPAYLRDPDNQWFALSIRARTIVFDKNKVQATDLSTYADLAQPKWRGKLCLRSSKKVYNQSLIAMLMAELGADKTQAIVAGWVANLATTPFADDTAVINAIAAGQCQVGVVNTYYLARLLNQKPELNVGLLWADQTGSGTHVNISGAGITRYAKNRAAAQQLIEYLSEPGAQQIYADQDLEYPVNSAIKPNSIIKQWGEFKANRRNIAQAGQGQAAATQLMDRAGYR